MKPVKTLKSYMASFQLGNRLKLKNIEKNMEFNLSFTSNRKHGLSAMMRVKNEERWILFAIKSILDDVDEIIILLQPCEDKTEKIIKSIKSNKIKLFHYPFFTYPAAFGYSNHPENSIKNLAYYYNYALSKTQYSYVWKWDGDQCAIESRLKELRTIIDSQKYDIIHYKGYDMSGTKLKHMCIHPYTSNEPSIFRMTNRTFYIGGEKCEEFSYPAYKSLFSKSYIYNYPKPAFLHFKYATEDIGKGWKEGWGNDEYFRGILDRKSQGQVYSDIYPEILKDAKIV